MSIFILSSGLNPDARKMKMAIAGSTSLDFKSRVASVQLVLSTSVILRYAACEFRRAVSSNNPCTPGGASDPWAIRKSRSTCISPRRIFSLSIRRSLAGRNCLHQQRKSLLEALHALIQTLVVSEPHHDEVVRRNHHRLLPAGTRHEV